MSSTMHTPDSQLEQAIQLFSLEPTLYARAVSLCMDIVSPDDAYNNASDPPIIRSANRALQLTVVAALLM